MKTLSIALIIVLSAVSFSSFANVNSNLLNFSFFSIGIENITYKEDVSNFLEGVSSGHNLNTKTSVNNAIQRSQSYTVIDDEWGVYINGTSTISQNFADEEWHLSGIGHIQNDKFKIRTTEVQVKSAYNVHSGGQLLVGFTLNTFDFTRSAFEYAQDGEKLNIILKDAGEEIAREAGFSQAEIDNFRDESGFDVVAGDISESSDNLDLSLGYLYDTHFFSKEKFQWYAGAEISFPVYYRVLNTFRPDSEHTGNLGDGIGAQLYGGMRWMLTNKLSVDLGMRGLYKSRKQIKKTFDDGTSETLPDISYQSVQYFLGINFRH
jgi:hypothetical protein